MPLAPSSHHNNWSQLCLPPLLAGRLGVLVCCVLSMLASFDEAVLGQFLERSLPGSIARSTSLLTDAQEELEVEEMLRPSRPEVNRRARWAGFSPLDPFPPTAPGDSRSSATLTLHIQIILTHLPGSEHAWRNGLGAPLLC